MNLLRELVLVVCFIAVSQLAMAQTDPSSNLVANAALSDAKGSEVKGWQLVQASAQATGGVADKGKQRHLYLRRTAAGGTDNFWWSQRLPASAGDIFQISYDAKASGEGDYDAYVGVELFDEAGKWLSFIPARTISYANVKWPNAAKPPVKQWTTFTDTFTLPPGTKSIGLRFALGGNGKAEADYRNFRLTRTSVTVASILAKQPAKLPYFQIPANPVSANGVALTPDWKLEGTEVLQSATRQKICLNGLWAIQPGSKDGQLPRENDWAFFKVPGYFIRELYSVYGQDKTGWAKRDLYQPDTPRWYVRDVEVPAAKGPSLVFLDLTGMPGYAIKVYWNGEPVGTLMDQLGGRIDLSAYARPGEKGQIAIYALCEKAEGKYAFRSDFVRMDNPTPWGQEGFHDLYLSIEPAHSYLERVRLSPSVRNKSLGVEVAPVSVDAAVTYKLKLLAADGSAVTEKDLGSGSARNGLQTFTVPWETPHLWNPDDPYLYSAVVQAYTNDRLVDESLATKFGFREVWVQGKELMLNGNPLRLRTRCWFERNRDGDSLRRAISVFKDTGFNCIIRPGSANTHWLEDECRWGVDGYYSVCDEMGMMVIPYTAYSLVNGGQFPGQLGRTVTGSEINELLQYTQKHQLETLYNHPSVIAYSGFGGSSSIGGNPLNSKPDVWGITPLDSPQFLNRIPNEPLLKDEILARAKNDHLFIAGIKKADPTRPFLSHNDSGEGDGWSIFDYFNWTPLQEWEDWPEQWASRGTKPVGSTEHGLPYPASFLNHAPAGGDLEPWVTEYAAGDIGPKAYTQETQEYLGFIRACYNPAAGNYTDPTEHGNAGSLAVTAAANIQTIWAQRNKAIYRAWRTYGVPMGIEPFGPVTQYIQRNAIEKDNGKVLADPSVNLKTVGAKLDRWSPAGFWPSEAISGYPQKPTGRRPGFLTPLGETLYENNSPLLAYIAGNDSHVTGKDHVFWSGETIRKQLAVVWDGFAPRSLSATWKARVGDKEIASGIIPLTLTPGQILTQPIEFPAPAAQGRDEGEILLEVRNISTGETVSTDRFPFQIYEPYHVTEKNRSARIALFDPAGESAGMFQRLGLTANSVTDLKNIPPCDILVIGRRALGKIPDSQWLDQLPAGVPVWILEQGDKDLAKLGFRTYPVRARRVFPLPAGSPMLKGISAPELADWRVAPTLLPAGTEPLRDGYNCHTGYYGTVASVTIETPTLGNFTPQMQSGFDLRETALLEMACKDHRVLFCQLSLTDGAAIDPVATRLADNILGDLLTTRANPSRPVFVVAANNQSDLAAKLAAPNAIPTSIEALAANGVALVETLPDHPAALRQWVEAGGRAVVLPQNASAYAKYFPSLQVASSKSSLIPMTDPPTALLQGVGQNNLHFRQPLPQILFNGKNNVFELSAGKGTWVLLGFDPRKLDIASQPYLVLTQRNQYRLLSQILTNLQADLSGPGRSVISAIGATSQRMDIDGLARIAPANAGYDWIQPEFDDSTWSSFDLKNKRAPFGKAFVRKRFTVPASASTALLVDLGTVDDYDQTFLNGVKIGQTGPENTTPDTAWSTRRLYPIPAGLLKPGQENVLAVLAWNRNADKGSVTWVRGPIAIRPANEQPDVLYHGKYKSSDDPYLQHHW